MNSQQFLILNIVILSFFILWFLAGRRAVSKRPTQLQMKQGNGAPPGGRLQKNSPSVGRYSHPKYQKYLESQEASPSKELNVLFNYNGHSWDAYEVFGLPAGASIVEVTKAYQEALRKSDPDSHLFLETAFKAVLGKKEPS